VNIAAPVLADAGRMCPADYVYPPAVFDRAADVEAGTLYVAGGLYGNLEALAEIERLAAAELAPTQIVFNGDFHWFDADPRWFEAIEAGVARHRRLRGNVETEIARPDDVGAGCGCAYPPSVEEGIVHRSNEILGELQKTAPRVARDRLARLPMHLVAQVGPLRVGIVHGDAASLAGWRFAQDSLDDPKSRYWLNDVRRASLIDVFASTHTCLAALRDFDLPAGQLTIANNGAAGMPNFLGTAFGLVTRIATSPSPHPPLYGMIRDGVHIDALPVAYDRDAFRSRFLARWPDGSPAHISYFERIEHGPDYAIGRACG
jgi:hypothetical protein